MSKFCTKCGAQCDDTTAFCTKCGAKLDGAAPAQAAAANGDEKTILDKFKENANMESIKELQKNPKFTMIVGVAVIAVALIIIIAIIASIASSGWKKPIKNFFKGIENTNVETYLKTMSEAKIDYLDEMYDDYEESQEEWLEDTMDTLEDDFGKNVKFSYKIVEKEEMKNRDLKDIEETYEEIYEEKVDVSKGYEVDVEYSIKGKEDKEKDLDATFYVVKVDGEWVLEGFELDDY